MSERTESNADKSQDGMMQELAGEEPETTSVLQLPSSRLLEAWCSSASALGDLETLLHLKQEGRRQGTTFERMRQLTDTA